MAIKYLLYYFNDFLFSVLALDNLDGRIQGQRLISPASLSPRARPIQPILNTNRVRERTSHLPGAVHACDMASRDAAASPCRGWAIT